MPAGPAAIRFRKLQNEIQMLWHEHPANQAREAAGQLPVNAFWPWSGAAGTDAQGTVPAGPPPDLTTLRTAAAQPWLDAVAIGTGAGKADPATAFASDSTIYCDHLSAAAIANDWSAWIGAMETVEREWFAPALAALQAGRTARVSLVMSSRELLFVTTTTRLAQRKFWRRATIDKLFK